MARAASSTPSPHARHQRREAELLRARLQDHLPDRLALRRLRADGRAPARQRGVSREGHCGLGHRRGRDAVHNGGSPVDARYAARSPCLAGRFISCRLCASASPIGWVSPTPTCSFRAKVICSSRRALRSRARKARVFPSSICASGSRRRRGTREGSAPLAQLFSSREEHARFVEEHARCTAPPRTDIGSYEGRAYLGVDSGSEAIKYALVAEDGSILRTYYKRSAGNLVEQARDMLVDLYKHIPRDHAGEPTISIAHAAVTGYGEHYLSRAFSFDSSEVETVCHVRATQELFPTPTSSSDIGGQDIKCVYRGRAASRHRAQRSLLERVRGALCLAWHGR